MSRRCKGCGQQFRPEFGQQRICWPCFRRLSGETPTRKENIMTTKTEIDWWAVTQAAQGLGIQTRRLVALHDPDAAITWALRMSREHTGTAALSYYELAVMLGHRDAKVTADASRDWNDLLRAAEKLAGTVRLKIAEEKLAEEPEEEAVPDAA